MREHQYVVPKDSNQQVKQTYNAQGMALNGSDQYLPLQPTWLYR